ATAKTLAEQIKANRGDDNERRKVREDKMGDVVINRPEFWLRGKLAKRQHDRKAQANVNCGHDSGGPLFSRRFRYANKNKGRGNAQCAIVNRAMHQRQPHIFLAERDYLRKHQTAGAEKNPVKMIAQLSFCSIHAAECEQKAPELDASNAQSKHYMRRAQDFYIQSIGVVPPIIKWSGSEHRRCAPHHHECA